MTGNDLWASVYFQNAESENCDQASDAGLKSGSVQETILIREYPISDLLELGKIFK